MSPQPVAQRDSRDAITRADRRLMALWGLALVLLYAASSWFGVRALRGYGRETERARQAFLQAGGLAGTGTPDLTGAGGATEVSVGVYVNRVGDFSSREGSWTADFDIWFRWSAGAPGVGQAVDPGESFELVNGEIDKRQRVEVHASGAERYERYRVTARLATFFDPARLPFGDQALTIQVEDGTHDVQSVRYVADERASGFNRRGIPSNIAVGRSLITVRTAALESALGDPSVRPDEPRLRSRLVFAMLASPPSWPLYLRNFQALFAAIAVAFIAFFVKPIHVDPRFGVGIGAIFTATANNITVGDSLAATGHFTLAAMINGVGLATIFLTLVASAISLYLFDTLGRERLSRAFDKVSFVAFLLGYGCLNVLLPLAAAR